MTILCFGDSLTSGHGLPRNDAFPAVLQAKIDAAGLPYRIVNAGISRDTSGGGLRRVVSALGDDVAVMVLALGINDGLRGVPVATVKGNLSAIIRAAQAKGIRVLLCRMETLPLYGWEYMRAFHRLYDELAAEYQLTLVPFILERLLGNRALMQADFVHPNAAGARAIAERVWPYLRAQLGVAASPVAPVPND